MVKLSMPNYWCRVLLSVRGLAGRVLSVGYISTKRDINEI